MKPFAQHQVNVRRAIDNPRVPIQDLDTETTYSYSPSGAKYGSPSLYVTGRLEDLGRGGESRRDLDDITRTTGFTFGHERIYGHMIHLFYERRNTAPAQAQAQPSPHPQPKLEPKPTPKLDMDPEILLSTRNIEFVMRVQSIARESAERARLEKRKAEDERNADMAAKADIRRLLMTLVVPLHQCIAKDLDLFKDGALLVTLTGRGVRRPIQLFRSPPRYVVEISLSGSDYQVTASILDSAGQPRPIGWTTKDGTKVIPFQGRVSRGTNPRQDTDVLRARDVIVTDEQGGIRGELAESFVAALRAVIERPI